MSPRRSFIRGVAAVFGLVALTSAAAAVGSVGSVFTYQGLLLQNGDPLPDGSTADLQFTLWDGSGVTALQIGSLQEALGMTLTGGLATVGLDFGPAAFAGQERWLQIAVRSPAGSGSYTTLSPRQPVRPSPYSIFSQSVGLVPNAALSGTYTNAVTFSNAANSFAGTHSGSGSGLTSLSAGSITGTLGSGLLGGSYGGITGVGTLGSLTVTGTTTGGSFSGSGANLTNLNAANIASNNLNVARMPIGGSWSLSSDLNVDSNTLVIDAANNRVGIGAASPTQNLQVQGNVKVTGWIGTDVTAPVDFFANGRRVLRLVDATAPTGEDGPNVMAGSDANTVSVGVIAATIAGGGATAGARSFGNRVTDDGGSVGGGIDNQAGDAAGTINDHSFATVGGGSSNTATGTGSVVGGGSTNHAVGDGSTVSGGQTNTASALRSTVGGGYFNAASGNSSTVPGGRTNAAGGNYSFAAGSFAKVRTPAEVGGGDMDGDEGTFVWNDSSLPGFTSTGPNQFLVHATGGVGINTNSPGSALQVAGGIRARGGSPGGVGVNNNGYAFSGSGGDNDSGMFSSADGQIEFHTNNVERLRINSAGNVGIGTATAAERLTVAAGASSTVFTVAPGHLFGVTGSTSVTLDTPGTGTIGVWDNFAVNNQMGIGTTDFSTHALSVNGTAANSTGSWSIFSDARLKQDIQPLPQGALERMLSLHGRTFEYRPEAIAHNLARPGVQTGFIAQEVEHVFPEWVREDADGYKYITERGTTALMVEALRELRAEKDAEVQSLRTEKDGQITQLRSELDELRSQMVEMQSILRQLAERERR